MIAVGSPCRQLLTEFINRSHPSGKALPCHNIAFYFGNVQPAAMLGSIGNLQFSGNSTCLWSWESLVQGYNGMGIEIIHYKDPLLLVWIADIHKISDFLSPVDCSTMFTDAYMSYAAQWLHEYKDTTGTISDIFGIQLLRIPGRMGSGSLVSSSSW